MRAFGAAALTLGLLGVSQALQVTILADTNRDGRVDATGETDHVGKGTWTSTSGALFLANIGDSNGRCAANITTDLFDSTFTDYSLCHDADDNIQRNPKYLAPVLTLPLSNLSALATGSVAVVDSTAASNVRVFCHNGTDWSYIAPNHTFTADQLRRGLNLGIDARHVRTAEWDGRATLQFSVTDGGVEASDTVAMRVAPVLTHHHVQRTEQVLATDVWMLKELFNQTNQFAADLERLSAQAGVPQPLYGADVLDNWLQDVFEAGYTTMPGPDGPVVLRIMIASAQVEYNRNRAHRWLFRELRSDTVGAVLHRTFGGTTDSTGNLETVPPYTLNGKSYPAGRAIMGSQHGVKPEMVKFLDAQEVQAPMEVDTTWLALGHVDEFMQFLPADSERGWVMMVDDPLAGLALLQQARDGGHGGARALSRARQPHDGDDQCLPADTIDDVLARADFAAMQRYGDEHIKASVAILERETGITEDEIFRVPTLYHPHENTLRCSSMLETTNPPPPPPPPPGQDSPAEQGHRRRRVGGRRDATPGPGDPLLSNLLWAARAAERPSRLARRRDAAAPAPPRWQVAALYPGCINGLVLSDTAYVAPNPWGPVVDGKDILATAVTAAYARANYTVHYVDDWFSHHVGQGEVHCGSNTIREITAKWW